MRIVSYCVSLHRYDGVVRAVQLAQPCSSLAASVSLVFSALSQQLSKKL
jgi:hypothetical protein